MYFTANSFNPQAGQTVGIIFSVNADSNTADLMIFNVAGERVRSMSLGPVSSGILYSQLAVWDGRADDGKLVTTGMYYIKLRAGSYEVIKPVAVIKK
ncbi:MAG TPA: FlgD immunoglobulin-like domain containing protein [Candidatus Goldiibacteriota bacterium]|nr:FlgD immunoglobulin-like domain containing protein [Candidatus Goldiibacteriota bacterium]